MPYPITLSESAALCFTTALIADGQCDPQLGLRLRLRESAATGCDSVIGGSRCCCGARVGRSTPNPDLTEDGLAVRTSGPTFAGQVRARQSDSQASQATFGSIR